MAVPPPQPYVSMWRPGGLPASAGGRSGDRVDERRPDPSRQVVAHPGHFHQLGVGDGRCGGAAAGGLDDPVDLAVERQCRQREGAQIGGAVAFPDTGRELASAPARSVSGARIGAARSVSGARIGAARSVSGARIGAARSVSGARIGAARSVGGARIGAARSVGGARIGAARSVGGARLDGVVRLTAGRPAHRRPHVLVVGRRAAGGTDPAQAAHHGLHRDPRRAAGGIRGPSGARPGRCGGHPAGP